MKTNKLAQKEEFFDFNEYNDSPGDEVVAGFVSGMIEASNNQAKMALELTKLIVNNAPSDKIDEKFVFSVFEKANKVVSKNQSLPELLKKVGMA